MKTTTFSAATALAFAVLSAARPAPSNNNVKFCDPFSNIIDSECHFQNNNFGNGEDNDNNNDGAQNNGVINASGKSSGAHQNNNFGNGKDDDNNNNGAQNNGVINASGKPSSQNNNFNNGEDNGNNNNGAQNNGIINARQTMPPTNMVNNNFGNGEDDDNNNSGVQNNGVINADGGVVINGNINAPVTIVNVKGTDGTSYWSAYGHSWENDSMLEHHMWESVNIPDGHKCSFRYNGGIYSYGSGVHSFPKHFSFTQAMCS